ncbi:MAG: ABC transporter substrate-binding protein [Actinomycetota bacterium]
MKRAWVTLLVASLAALAVSGISIQTPQAASTKTTYIALGGKQGSRIPGQRSTKSQSFQTIGSGPILPPAPPGISCDAAHNGGATDVGVTSNQIQLGATIVDSGPGASFLRDARFSMLALQDKVNRNGGICGRKLNLLLKDDGWDFARGAAYLKDMVEGSHVFALAVVPSSEGLRSVSDSGYLDQHKVPVVGSDGMLIDQYQDPYIWPVAASTASTMHIIAKWAHDTGAQNFGIVYEEKYHFGLEGAYAFNAAVKRLTGSDIPGYSNPETNAQCSGRFCGINPDSSSYSAEINTFNQGCKSNGNPCDFIALLLEPSTALKWLTSSGAITPSQGIRMAGPQPLFSQSFAENCGAPCDKLYLFTSFLPPLSGNAQPDIVTYQNDLTTQSPQADPLNTFAEGAYVGMSMLIDALQRVGPLLTRDRLTAVLDATTYLSGLTRPLTFSPGNHFANVTMQAYSIQFKDRFSGFKDEQVTMTDPWVGQDIPR